MWRWKITSFPVHKYIAITMASLKRLIWEERTDPRVLRASGVPAVDERLARSRPLLDGSSDYATGWPHKWRTTHLLLATWPGLRWWPCSQMEWIIGELNGLRSGYRGGRVLSIVLRGGRSKDVIILFCCYATKICYMSTRKKVQCSSFPVILNL